MAEFGITPDGFVKKKLPDVREDIIADLVADLGAIDTDPQSTISQLIDPFAESASILWDLGDDIYQNFIPSGAEGKNLDDLLDLNGLTRLGATSSTAFVSLLGTNSTLVPSGTQFKQDGTNELFNLESDVTISSATSIETVFSLTIVATATTYEIILGVTTVSIVSSSADEISILTQLAGQVTIATSGSQLGSVVGLTLLVVPSDGRTSYAATASTNTDRDQVSSEGSVSAVIPGATSVPIGTIINIETPVSGLDAVNNLVTGVSGRNLETDDEARVRRKQSLRVAGAATVPSIEARLLNDVVGVTAATVIDNRTDVVDGAGRPPHSFEAIVTGGTDQAIIDKLWEVKPAGINTFGNVSGFATDSQGTLQVINFSRPTELAITVTVEFNEDLEQILPLNFEQAIKDAIVEFSLTEQDVSDDVTVQRYFTPIFSIPGVGVVTLLEMNKPATPVTTTIIVVASNEIATFSTVNITVTKNP